MSARPESLSGGIDPFWNRLREITRYPAHFSALIPIVMFALANLLVFVPFGFILALLADVAMYRYAFDCLRATADGWLEPPDKQWSGNSRVGWKYIGLMIVLAVFAGICFAVLGPGPGAVILLLLGLALPSATIVLAMTDSLSAALSPTKWLVIIMRIGWPYLAAVGLFLVVFLSERYAQGWVARIMPVHLAVVVIGVISNYALVVTFHLMGYLVYQYHEPLGYEPKRIQVEQAMHEPDPDQDLLDEAAALVRDGKADEATALLYKQLHNRGGSTAVHGQYRKLLRLTGNTEGLLQHGSKYLGILLAQHENHAALELLRECRTLDRNFVPAKAKEVTVLARLAAERGQPQLALQLLSGFHERFPESPDIVENYLLVASLMHEHLNRDETARQLLLSLKAKYPDSPLMPEIDKRLALVEQMMESAGALDSKA